VLGSTNPAPLDAPFLIAQAPPQSEQDKKPPQRPGQRPRETGQNQAAPVAEQQ
jgi:hypothetical protein